VLEAARTGAATKAAARRRFSFMVKDGIDCWKVLLKSEFIAKE
jgi:hypothetical protein